MLMARDFKGGFKIAVYARTVYVRRVVEREGVMKFPPALSRKASVQAAAFSHFRHIGPSRGWVGYRGRKNAECRMQNEADSEAIRACGINNGRNVHRNALCISNL